MTNNHILNQKQLNSSSKDLIFKISFKKKIINSEGGKLILENKEGFVINSNDIIFSFIDELIDVTFIELSDKKINEIKPHFLKPCNKNCMKNDPIMVIQYPINNNSTINSDTDVNHYTQRLSIGIGYIKYLSGINYCHTSSTFFSSSGSPLINNLLEVVGIHKSYNTDENENYSINILVAIYAISTTYERKYNKNEISNTFSIPETLSDKKVKSLNKHLLIQQENKKIFKYEGNKVIPPLLLFRTNYAWFWTNKIPKKNNIEQSVSDLKWSIIIPHDKINKNENLIIPFHKYLLKWLRLSEFMYLKMHILKYLLECLQYFKMNIHVYEKKKYQL